MYSNLDSDDCAREQIQFLLKAQAEGQYSSTCLYKHHEHTPFKLCDEVLGQIDHSLCSDSTTYLILFNLEFLYSLTKFIDFGEERVYYYTTDKNKERLASLLFPEVIVLDELEDNMKFDIVVGNPPFLKGTWATFLRKSANMARETVCMISPDGSSGFSTRAEKLKEDLTSFGLIGKVDCTDHFPKVESGKIVYYVIDKSKAGIPFVEPVTLGASIIKKIINSNHNRIYAFLSGKRGKADTSHHSPVPAAGKIEYLKSVTNTDFTMIYADEDKVHVVNNASDNWYTNRYFGKNADCNLVDFNVQTLGISPNILGIRKPAGWSSSEFVRVYNSSKLFKFVLDTFRAGGFDTSPQHMNRLPELTVGTWTDKELYDEFDLTPEERLHIDPEYKN